jgi:DNA polymerase I
VTIKNYGLVDDLQHLQELVDKLLKDNTAVGLDIETGYEGPDKASAQFHPEEGFVVGISFTNSLDWARYIPLRHDFADNLEPLKVAEIMWPLFKSGLVVAHNAKFELRMLSVELKTLLGEAVVGCGYFPVRSDSMIEASMMGIYKSVGLKNLTKVIFDHEMTMFEDLFPGVAQNKKKSLRFNILDLTPEVIAYACEDALWCLALHELHFPQVQDALMFKVEMEVLKVLCEMEDYGVKFDWEFMRKASIRAKEFSDIQYAEIQKELSRLVGRDVSINLGSPSQVSSMLYDELGFSTTRMTKTSQNSEAPKMSTDKIALEGLAQEHEVVRHILEWKEVKKLIGSYLDKYERDFGYDTERYGFTHPSHLQTYVISGRFSVSEPGYQQLPAGNYETPEKKKITRYVAGDEVFELCFRDSVTVPDDYYGVGFDYSQAELRALAGESGEPALIEAFDHDLDVHKRTAGVILGKPESEVTGTERKVYGKLFNFALLYGMGIKSLGERLGISYEEAEVIYNRYFAGYSKIAAYMDKQMSFGKENGFVVSKFGRKITIWEYQDPNRWVREKADRMAVNLVIQGSATGDMPKIAMVRARKAIINAGLSDKIHLVMNIHDALEFYVHKSIPLDDVIKLLEPAVVFKVPGWPKIVADWHTWTRLGSAQEVVQDNGQWVPVVHDFSAADYKAVIADIVSANAANYVLEISDYPTRDQFSSLIKLAKANSGENRIDLKTPQGQITLPVPTNISSANLDDVTSIFGASMVSLSQGQGVK